MKEYIYITWSDWYRQEEKCTEWQFWKWVEAMNEERSDVVIVSAITESNYTLIG